MLSITVRNVNDALPLALSLLRDTGKPVAPRGMMTTEIEGPFATTYTSPEEMVLFDGERDANPFFHFFEALWILQGRNDVGFLAWFLPRMADFSDNGSTFHAPYGYRLRGGEGRADASMFDIGLDQIEMAIRKLSEDKDSRQAVLTIWDKTRDWQRTKDVPCNDMLMFKIRDGKLRMTVCNRSNDAVLGAYGANVVQFSTLQVYMAARIGVDVGSYTQVSDSFHVYEDNPYWQAFKARSPSGVPVGEQPYDSLGMTPDKFFLQPAEIGGGQFDEDLKRFFYEWDKQYGNLMHGAGISGKMMNERWYLTSMFTDTVLPMMQTFYNWKQKQHALAFETATHIKAVDWKIAAVAWMQRRWSKMNQQERA